MEKDEPLFEISTDKVDAEIPSPVAGVLTEIRVSEGGDTVEINTVVAVIGGAAAAAAPVAGTNAVPTAPAQRNGEKSCLRCTAAPAPEVQVAGSMRSSPLVRRIARENNLDLSQIRRHRLRTAASPRKMCCAT